MTENEKIIYRRIDELLWSNWDPIGINDTPEARNEYQSYLPEIFALKINNAGRDKIANSLYKIETNNMGLDGNIIYCQEIADKILSL